LVINGSWQYQTKAQEDYGKTKNKISSAFNGIFHDGNIFKKIGDTWDLAINSTEYPFVWAAVKYKLNNVGVSWSNSDGIGIIIGKDELGEFNFTIGDARNFAIFVAEDSDQRAFQKIDFTPGIYIEQPSQFSYGMETLRVGPEQDRRLTKATLTPLVAKEGTYFTSMINVNQRDVYELFSSQRILNGYDWTSEQKDALGSVLFDSPINQQKQVDDLAAQLKGELISNHLEHFYDAGPIESAILAECISWSINRIKNGLKPEYKMQLYALVGLAKYTYDQSGWAQLLDRNKSSEMTDRQKAIIAGAMEALDEFDKFLRENNQERNQYDVRQIPFKY
jgi:hypothetical protein